MFALRRGASRLLSIRSTSFISPSRTYTSFSAPSSRLAQRSPAFQLQRRWATTDAEGDKPAVSAVEPTPAEEVENAAEIAIDGEAAEEVLPGATVGEDVSAKSRSAPAAGTAATGSGPGNPSMFEQKATLYVGNLFFDVTETDLVKEFARFGTVAKCRIVRDARGLSKGFGYIDFSSQEAADAALERLNMSLFEGRRITVQYAARKSTELDESRGERKPVNPPSKTLFIGNMSFEMTDRDLTNLFRGVRNVIDVRVAIDRRTGQPRGFAHADFVDVKSAMEAAKMLAEKEIYGRKLRIDYSYSSTGQRAPKNDPPIDN